MIRKLIKALLKFNLKNATPRKPDSDILLNHMDIETYTGFVDGWCCIKLYNKRPHIWEFNYMSYG